MATQILSWLGLGTDRHASESANATTQVPLDPSYLRYFRTLAAEYKSLSKTCGRAEEREVLDSIVAKHERGELEREDIFIFEVTLIRILPFTNVKPKVWSIRDRYRRVVGQEAYRAYLDSHPPEFATNDSNDAKTESLVKADLVNLYSEMHRIRLLHPAREGHRRELATEVRHAWLNIAMFAALAWLFVPLVNVIAPRIATRLALDPPPWIDPWYLVIALVAVAGATGALVSTERRIYELSGENIRMASEGRASLCFAPYAGAIFAIVLLLLLVGGIIGGSIFPKDLKLPPRNVNGTAIPALLVWSFIAGFAERFVPDTLDRTLAKERHSHESK